MPHQSFFNATEHMNIFVFRYADDDMPDSWLIVCDFPTWEGSQFHDRKTGVSVDISMKK